jgi:hypothetical protein
MSTTDFVKTALNVFKEANRLDLAEELVQLRQDKLAVEEENLRLKSELQKWKVSAETEKQVRFEGGLHWLIADPVAGGESNTPICGRCWDAERLVIRQVLERTDRKLGYRCQNCAKWQFIEPVPGYQYPRIGVS